MDILMLGSVKTAMRPRPARRVVTWAKRARVLFAALVVLAAAGGAGNAKAAPLTYTVNTTSDDPNYPPFACANGSAGCSLRGAITGLNSHAGADVINFNLPAGSIIKLTQGLPDLTDAVTITGPGADKLTVQPDTGGNYRIFNVTTTGVVNFSGLTISKSLVPSGGGSRGGGINNANAGTVNISNCIISENRADGGGGVANQGTMTISNSTVSANVAAMGAGGGILNQGSLTISNTTFSNNSARGTSSQFFGGSAFGGAVSSSGDLSVTNSSFSGNLAQGGSATDFTGTGDSGNGGALSSTGLSTNIINSTFSGNVAMGGFAGTREAPSSGGAIYCRGAATNITNSTLSGNRAQTGGGLYKLNGSSINVTVKSSLIALNMASSGMGPDVYDAFTSQGFNLIGKSDGSTGFSAATDQTGTVASPKDPKLDPNGLQDNGGPTQTIALLSTSPAVDKGTSNGLTGKVTTDQRGFPRPSDVPNIANPSGGDGSDIGAFETAIPGTLANISTRMRVETGDNVLIGGFIITGTQSKKVIVLAIGPSLPLADRLANPTLELYQDSTLLDSNDNWVDSANKQAIIDSGIAPPDNLESAIVATLPANGSQYTAIVRGAGGGTGIGSVQIYDLDRTADSKLANISTRGLVQTGDNVLIAGTIVLGQAQQKVIVCAIGPSLSVPGKLADPTLELRDANGTLLDQNDNWVDSANKQAIIDSTIPPANDLESAIVATLPSNGAQYTAIVRGVNDTTGIAVVEVFALQ